MNQTNSCHDSFPFHSRQHRQMEAIQLPGDEKNKIWIFYRAIRAKKRRVVHWVEMGDRNGAILRAQADQPINALPCETRKK